MNMRTPSRSSTAPSATGMIPWTGVLVFTHVQAVETNVGKTLCPARLLRQFRTRLRRLTR
jgi:hypothetical protein